MFKVQTNKLFPNYVFLVSVVTSESQVHICPFPETLGVLRIFSFTKISSWKTYKCLITSFVSSMCVKSRAGPVWSRLHWRKQSAACHVTVSGSISSPQSPQSDLGGPIGGQCWAASSNQRPHLHLSVSSDGSPGGCGDSTALSWSQTRVEIRDRKQVNSSESQLYLNILIS